MNPEMERVFIETLTNIFDILKVQKEQIPQTFLSYQSKKNQLQENYFLSLEEKNNKKQLLENNLREYNLKLEIAKSELLRQQKLLSELYKTLGRNL